MLPVAFLKVFPHRAENLPPNQNNFKAAGSFLSGSLRPTANREKNTNVPHWLNATFDKSLLHMGFLLWFMLLIEGRVFFNKSCFSIQSDTKHRPPSTNSIIREHTTACPDFLERVCISAATGHKIFSLTREWALWSDDVWQEWDSEWDFYH